MYIKEHCTGANCIVGLPAVQIKCYQSKLDKLHLHSVQKCTEVYMNTVRGDAAATIGLIGYSVLLSTLVHMYHSPIVIITITADVIQI